MSEEPVTYRKDQQRVHCLYSDRYLKRSLAPSEYVTTPSGHSYVPFHNRERLENKVACIEFIREMTDIPVPEVINAYEKDGSFHIWTKLIRGVSMNELKDEDRWKVIPEIRKHLATLKTLRSKVSGGPSGILCPPHRVTNHCDRNTTWQRISADDDIYVFCHCDLSDENIMVDPVTLKVLAIIDWEFSGFYPEEHEIPFYERRKPSGAQSRYFPRNIDHIKRFWEDSTI